MSLNEIKKCSLSILKYVDKVCKDNKISYYLAAGTLLGAVRHKGFIPWDDDIDIMIPRRDYEKLKLIFPQNDRYSFLTYHNTPNFPFAYGKIIDKNTIKREFLRPKYQLTGVDIDVFPIDNYPDDFEEANKWCNLIKKANDTVTNICSPYVKGRNIPRMILRNTLVLFRHFLDDTNIKTSRRYIKKLDYLSQYYNKIETGYCGIASISAYGIKKRNHRTVFEGSIDIEFEGSMFPAPIGYDDYLKDYYDNYMELPPVEKRATHHKYKAYWRL